LSNPEERLGNGFQTQAIVQDLQGYLTQTNAEVLIIGTYILLLGIFYVFLSISVEQRIKQMGIFKAIGARHHDVLKIFVWEALLLGVSSFILSSMMAYTYLLDINKKFYDGLQVLNLYQAQIVFHGGLSLILPSLFIVGLTLNTLRKNSVISILKES
jgi:ABC-type lipoprotein release transport system permease subunit